MAGRWIGALSVLVFSSDSLVNAEGFESDLTFVKLCRSIGANMFVDEICSIFSYFEDLPRHSVLRIVTCSFNAFGKNSNLVLFFKVVEIFYNGFVVPCIKEIIPFLKT